MNASDNDMNLISNYSVAVDPTQIFGPQRDSLYLIIPVTVIYSLIFVTGLFGNIFTCIVIIRNKSMHTATNYYLFSLAISDLLLLVSGMPQEMYSIWSKWPYVFGHTFCLIRGLAAETSTNASVLTITLFTVERYLAICHPFISHKMSKLSRATKHVLLLWMAAFGLALPQALQFGIRDHRGVIMCLQTRVIIEHSFELSTFFFFFAPMILITVLYSLIGLRLKETTTDKDKNEFERNIRFTHRIRRKNSQSTRRVVKMLVAVVVAFFVCWAPFHAQRLVAIYGTGENHMAISPILLFVYSAVTYTSGVFYYMSTCINPIFYHIMSNKFREAFKNTMRQCCCRDERHIVQRCSYTAIALKRNPNSRANSLNSGNSFRVDASRHSKVTKLDSGEKLSYANNHLSRLGSKVNVIHEDSRTHGSKSDPATSAHIESIFTNQPFAERGVPFTDISIVSEKRKFCAPNCCGKQESPCETMTPTPDVMRSSEENKTEYYPDDPEKYINDIKMRILQREQDCRKNIK